MLPTIVMVVLVFTVLYPKVPIVPKWPIREMQAHVRKEMPWHEEMSRRVVGYNPVDTDGLCSKQNLH